MMEYHQEIVVLPGVADTCNAAAKDGWRLHSLMVAMAHQGTPGGLVTPTSGGMVQVAVLLFERPLLAQVTTEAPAPRNSKRVLSS